jgi:hypothetical protein
MPEMKFTRRHVIAIAIGACAFVLLQQGTQHAARLIEECCISQNRSVLWVSIALNVLVTLGLLVPGFLAGLVARSRGILVGFLAGLLGGVLFSLTVGIIRVEGSWFEILTSGSQWLFIIGNAFVLSLSTAAAGGAAQAMRSTRARVGHAP